MTGKRTSVRASGQGTSWLGLATLPVSFAAVGLLLYGAIANVNGLPIVAMVILFGPMLAFVIDRGRPVFGAGSRATPAQKRIWAALTISTGACLAVALGAGLALIGSQSTARWAVMLIPFGLGAAGVIAVQTYGIWVMADQKMPQQRSGGLGIK
jgi:hypothetical protein